MGDFWKDNGKRLEKFANFAKVFIKMNMRDMRRKILLAIISMALIGGTSSCASWWSASVGPGGPRVNVGGSLPTKSSSTSTKKTTKGQNTSRSTQNNDDIYQ